MTEFPLRGRRIVVTGGAEGIGYQIALAAVRNGADVAILDLGEDRSRQRPRRLAGGCRLGRLCLMRRERPCPGRGGSRRLASSWGEADGLVNNAGIVQNVPAVDVLPEDWRTVIEVNLSGVFYCSQVFGASMLAVPGAAS